MAPQTESAAATAGSDIRGRVKSVAGVLRLLQLLLGACIWVTIAANRYDGAVHFALAVAVLFWLLTLAALVLGALDRHWVVPLIGGERWPITTLVLDVGALVLLLVANGILGVKMERLTYCTVTQYKYKTSCLYSVYLTATIFAALTSATYLVSAVYRIVMKCRGQTPPL
ncbi:MARVEL domain-containing protein 1 [Engraulis encrasicolus]|uniref:MARVEL domain-containing protein 1 n=1 Tax=Engraulis encrasicolus TaxID=184585 RepID=UPI002FD36BB9